MHYSRPVFFNLFAAAEPYKCDNPSRNPMQWREFNGVYRQSGIFRVSGDWCCLRVKKQKTCGSLEYGAYPLNTDNKAAGKRLV